MQRYFLSPSLFAAEISPSLVSQVAGLNLNSPVYFCLVITWTNLLSVWVSVCFTYRTQLQPARHLIGFWFLVLSWLERRPDFSGVSLTSTLLTIFLFVLLCSRPSLFFLNLKPPVMTFATVSQFQWLIYSFPYLLEYYLWTTLRCTEARSRLVMTQLWQQNFETFSKLLCWKGSFEFWPISLSLVLFWPLLNISSCSRAGITPHHHMYFLTLLCRPQKWQVGFNQPMIFISTVT